MYECVEHLFTDVAKIGTFFHSCCIICDGLVGVREFKVSSSALRFEVSKLRIESKKSCRFITARVKISPRALALEIVASYE